MIKIALILTVFALFIWLLSEKPKRELLSDSLWVGEEHNRAGLINAFGQPVKAWDSANWQVLMYREPYTKARKYFYISPYGGIYKLSYSKPKYYREEIRDKGLILQSRKK